MKISNLGLMFVLSVTRLWASDVHGTAPRAEASRYPASTEQGQLGIGARWLTIEQIRQAIVPEVHQSVLVMEVAVFPGKGSRPIMISRSDFAVRKADSDSVSKPLHPRAVAMTAQRRSGEGVDTETYEQVGIGYEKGERTNPITGQPEKVSGVYTTTGTGVTVRSKGGPPTERDLEAIERELSYKSLPEGTVGRPVSGYLYFPFPDKKRVGPYELVCTLGGVRMVLPLRTSR